jgi:MFS family permease
MSAAVRTPQKRASHYTLAVFLLVQIFYYTDRNMLNILLEPIRQDLKLSDGQIGTLTGIAFAFAYALFTIPIGRISDRRNRIWIIAAACVVWSGFTIAFGMVRSYAAILAMRIGVAAGEAGGLIPMQSVISDSYTPARRGLALAVLYAGGTIGMMIGYSAAGLLNDHYGWRTTFAVIGALGLLTVPLLLTLRDPARGASEDFAVPEVTERLGLAASLKALASRRSYVLLIVGFTFASVAVYGQTTWLPTYLIRRFHLSTGETGLLTTATTVAPLLVGMLAGGFSGDVLFRKWPKWVLRLPALCLLISFPATLAQMWAPSLQMVVAAGVVPGLVAGFYVAPLMSGLHALAGVRLRGFAIALATVAMLLVGQGLGPSLVGLLSDALGGADAGYRSLSLGVSWVSSLYVVGGLILWAAGGSFVADLRAVRRFDGAPT